MCLNLVVAPDKEEKEIMFSFLLKILFLVKFFVVFINGTGLGNWLEEV